MFRVYFDVFAILTVSLSLISAAPLAMAQCGDCSAEVCFSSLATLSVESAAFTYHHEKYLAEHPQFAQKLFKIYAQNKERTDRQTALLHRFYANSQQKAFRHGALPLVDYYAERDREATSVEGYFFFPYLAPANDDLLFCYFHPEESRQSADAYWSYLRRFCDDIRLGTGEMIDRFDFKVIGPITKNGYKPPKPPKPPKPVDCRHHSLITSTNSLSLLYRRNARSLINLISAESKQCGVSGTVDDLRTIYAFRNINVLRDAVKYIEQNNLQGEME